MSRRFAMSLTRVAIAAMIAAALPAVTAFGEAVPVEQVVPPIAGDAIDLALLPHPREAAFTGRALRFASASIRPGPHAETPAAKELAALFTGLGVLDAPGTPLARVEVAEADESVSLRWQPAPTQGYVLSVKAEDDGVRVRIETPAPAGLHHAVQTLRQLCLSKDGQHYLREGRIEDWPGLTWRGVKAASPAFLALYAPYKLNFGWRYVGLWPPANPKRQQQIDALNQGIDELRGPDGAVPDDEAGRARLAAMTAKLKTLQAARDRAVVSAAKSVAAMAAAYRDACSAVAVSYNPGGTLDVTDAWLDTVRGTYRFYYDAGVRHFVMSFDDQAERMSEATKKRFATYPHAQAFVLGQVADWLREWDADNRFYLCHQAYFLSAAAESKPVANLVEVGLPEDLQMCWTGNGVTTRHLTLEKVKAYRDAFGRPATFFYHNWPITAPKTRSETGPLPPHDDELGRRVAIYMMCSNHDRASYVAFLTGLDWAWNPPGYDPARSIAVAAREWARRYGQPPAEAYAALEPLLQWTRTHDSTVIVPDQPDRSVEALRELVAQEEALYARHLPRLKEHLKDPPRLPGMEGTRLADEIAATTKRRLAHFRRLVEMQALARSGKAVRTDTPITLDGRLDEPAWAKAPALDPFVDFNSTTPAEPGTTARVLYDDQHLYVGVRCDEPALDQVQARTGSGWGIHHGDCLQLWFDHTHAKRRLGYACTTIHGQASLYRFGWQWMKGFEVKIARGPKAWTAEFALPTADLPADRRPKPGVTWDFNVVRLRSVKGAKSQRSSWNPCSAMFKAVYTGDLTFE